MKTKTSPRSSKKRLQKDGIKEIPRSKSIMRLKGLGKEIWKGVDVQKYLDELRDEWNEREASAPAREGQK